MYNLNNYKEDPFFKSEYIRGILRHRGPDDFGYYKDDKVELVFNRLSIIDLSENAHQPMSNEKGDIWLIFNGEVYNYLELSNELKLRGHKFKSNSDSEVVIHAYEEFGIDCQLKFNGMWSFVIYDKRKNKLFCSRDRFGEKPFYYYIDNNKIIFASEIKAILKAGVKAEPNEKQVFNYLAYAQLDTSSETMFRDIFQILPAHYMVIENGSSNIARYWGLKNEKNKDDLLIGEEELLSRFRDLFFSSIKLRLRSDVPLGILLSGGLDSSAIVSSINYIFKEENLPLHQIKTFTASYKKEQIDESAYAKEVVRGTNIPNILVFPNSNRNIGKDIEKVIYQQDEPTQSMTVFAHWYLMEEIKKHDIKVIISGQGSDEMLGGYLEVFMGYYLKDLLLNCRYSKYIDEVKQLKRKSHMPYKIIILQFMKALVSRRLGLIIKSYFRDRGISFLKPEFVKNNWKSYDYRPTMTKYSNLNEGLFRLFTRESLPLILHYEDRNSMAFSIEQRTPFLDYRLVEFLFGLSNKQKIDGGISKVILRKALKDILPRMIINRYSKLGFAVPQANWIKEMGDYIKDILGSIDFQQRVYWDSAKVRILCSDQLNNNTEISPFLWRVIACEIWHKVFIH
jgi:asparagine synthase (glutamine-hydrolysing)